MTRLQRARVVVVLAVGLTLAACGGGSGDSTRGDVDGSGPTDSAAADTVVRTVDTTTTSVDTAPTAADTAPTPMDAVSSAPDTSAATDAVSSQDTTPTTTDPADPGPFTVAVSAGVTLTISSGDVAATICAPAGPAGGIAAGPHPLVILSPGFNLPRAQYRSSCEHLASWGLLTVAQDYAGEVGVLNPPNHGTLARDVGLLIDVLAADPTWGPRVDAGRIATVGHSLGGKVSIHAAILDARVDAAVGWDPVDATPPIPNGSLSVAPELMDGLTAPLLVLGETLDSAAPFGAACAPAGDNYVAYAETACASAEVREITIAGADHMDWIDDRATCGLTCLACQTGAIDDAVTRAISRRATTAFIYRHVLGDDTLSAWLSAPLIGVGATVRLSPCVPL